MPRQLFQQIGGLGHAVGLETALFPVGLPQQAVIGQPCPSGGGSNVVGDGHCIGVGGVHHTGKGTGGH